MQRAIAIDRSKGLCEWHGVHSGPEWNHSFGRNDEPWSSFAPLTIMLCTEIHGIFHTNQLIRERIQWRSLYLLAEILDIKLDDKFDPDPLPVFRSIMRDIKKMGVVPDGYARNYSGK